MLSYIQRGLVDIWKDNLLKNLELEKAEFGSVGEFLLELKKEFGEENKESIKVVELKRKEQGKNMMEEFIQEF